MDKVTAKDIIAMIARHSESLGDHLAVAEEFVVRVERGFVPAQIEPLSAPSYVTSVTEEEARACEQARLLLEGVLEDTHFGGVVSVERVGARLWADAVVFGDGTEHDAVEQVILLD